MFYICDSVNDNHEMRYGVKDTDDGVIEYFTLNQLKEYLNKGVKILGCCTLGVFELNENQLVSFETYIKLLNKFNKDINKDGRYKFEVSREMCFTDKNFHSRRFYAYHHGLISSSVEHVFNLNSDGNIVCYTKHQNSAVPANLPGYNGSYSDFLVLYFGAKPRYKIDNRTYKYYSTVSSLYKNLVK